MALRHHLLSLRVDRELDKFSGQVGVGGVGGV